MTLLSRAVLALVLTALANPAPATGERQSLAAIREAVDAFVRDHAEGSGEITAVQVDRLDPRLRLAACGAPLQVRQPEGYSGPGRLTVAVHCVRPKPWRVYVPVRITRELAVVVATRPLPRGRLLTGDDLQRQRVSRTDLRGQYYTDAAELVGQETGRSIRNGEVLDSTDVHAPRLVRRGQALLIEAGTDRMTVRMRGKALEDGRSGDLIRVRNDSSRRIVEARVVGRDRVRVTF